MAFSGLGLHLGNLSRLSNAQTRSISPENFTGEKGKGGMAIDGAAARQARDLGRGWKVSPYVVIEPGTTFTLADIEGQGAIQQIWMTLARGRLRHSIAAPQRRQLSVTGAVSSGARTPGCSGQATFSRAGDSDSSSRASTASSLAPWVAGSPKSTSPSSSSAPPIVTPSR